MFGTWTIPVGFEFTTGGITYSGEAGQGDIAPYACRRRCSSSPVPRRGPASRTCSATGDVAAYFYPGGTLSYEHLFAAANSPGPLANQGLYQAAVLVDDGFVNDGDEGTPYLTISQEPSLEALTLLQATLFHRPRNTPPEGTTIETAPMPPAPVAPGTGVASGAEFAPNVLDFHQVVAGLADHPGLMRALGLVVELAVAIPASTITAGATIQAVPTWTPLLATDAERISYDVLPATTTDANGWPEAADPAAALSEGGFLQLELDTGTDVSPAPFTVMEVDVDGGACFASPTSSPT